jgi:hypothetical protein
VGCDPAIFLFDRRDKFCYIHSMKYYTGVGSRCTPNDVLSLEVKFALRLNDLGWTLRSGGAIGSDKAFESGSTNKNIYYADQKSANKNKGIYVPITDNDKAFEIISKIHPNWARCSEFARLLHRRNCFQVLGPNLNEPSEFLVCWTPCGAESAKECVYSKDGISTGGTATAIRVADSFNVPIFNLGKLGSKERFINFMKSYNER